MILKTWERYFIRQTLKTFFLFICCFYSLYVLIDYATHLHHFHQSKTAFQWGPLFFYYLFDFIKLLEVLIPFALLISTIKMITSLNMHNELVALLSSGIKLKRLLRPFLILGFLFTALLYFNTEIFLPQALKELKSFKEDKAINKAKNLGTKQVLQISLEDGSLFIFQNYNSKEHYFTDSYWIRSIDDLYRIKFLYPNKVVPEGATFINSSQDLAERGKAGSKRSGLNEEDMAKAATFINSSQDLAERGKAGSKRSGLNEEDMASAMSDEEDRSGDAAAGQIPDEFMKVAAKAMSDEEDRSGDAAAGQIPDEFMKVAAKAMSDEEDRSGDAAAGQIPDKFMKVAPEGHFVDHLKRNDEGKLLVVDSYQLLPLKEMHFNKQTLFESITNGQEQSMRDLYGKILSFNEIKSEKQAQLVTSFYYKLALPWLALLVVIAPIPFCVYFTRHLPIFMIYALSIFGLVAFYIIMHSALVLGERQVFSPLLAIALPFTLFMAIFGFRYYTLK